VFRPARRCGGSPRWNTRCCERDRCYRPYVRWRHHVRRYDVDYRRHDSGYRRYDAEYRRFERDDDVRPARRCGGSPRWNVRCCERDRCYRPHVRWRW